MNLIIVIDIFKSYLIMFSLLLLVIICIFHIMFSSYDYNYISHSFLCMFSNKILIKLTSSGLPRLVFHLISIITRPDLSAIMLSYYRTTSGFLLGCYGRIIRDSDHQYFLLYLLSYYYHHIIFLASVTSY